VILFECKEKKNKMLSRSGDLSPMQIYNIWKRNEDTRFSFLLKNDTDESFTTYDLQKNVLPKRGNCKFATLFERVSSLSVIRMRENERFQEYDLRLDLDFQNPSIVPVVADLEDVQFIDPDFETKKYSSWGFPTLRYRIALTDWRIRLQEFDSTTPSDGFVQVSRYLLENIQPTNLPIIADFLGQGELGRQVYNNQNTIFSRRENTSVPEDEQLQKDRAIQRFNF
jgi:hypothetical protein